MDVKNKSLPFSILANFRRLRALENDRIFWNLRVLIVVHGWILRVRHDILLRHLSFGPDVFNTGRQVVKNLLNLAYLLFALTTTV